MALDGLLNTYIVEDDEGAAFSVANEISKTSTLLDIVRALEDPLTQEDAAVRSKATQCLTDVIKHLKDLKTQEIAVLAMFLVDRLEDFASVGSAADGLSELVTREGFRIPDGSFWSKLREVNMLDLDQPVRFKVFTLLDKLSNQGASGFVPTFVALASGEKDPQNLMISLKISQHILAKHGDSLAREQCAELYDITFCYFPITFNPPKDMPVLITADQIRERLRAALVSPAIAQWVVPGVIGKLTAVSIAVKVDALVTLDAVVLELKRTGELHNYWRAIWDGTRYEVLHGTPQSETHQPVITLLSRLVDIPDFLKAVVDEFSVAELPRGKLAQLCSLVVGISTSNNVWDTLAPPAMEKAMETASLLNLFLAAPYTIPFSDRVMQSLLVSLANGEKRDSTEGLKLLALHESEYTPLIVQKLTQEKAYSALAELAETRPDAIKDYCLPQLMSELPSSLDALGRICCVRSLVHVLTVRLLSRIGYSKLATTGQYDSEEVLAFLNTLVESSGHLKSTADLTGYDRVLVTPLIEKFQNGHNFNEEIVDAACILLERAARGVPVERQAKYASGVLSFLPKVHFHLILSALAPMKEFPFESKLFSSQIVPKLSATGALLERAAYLRATALAANKWPQSVFEDLDTEKLQECIENGDVNALELFAWLTKGLLLRADKIGFDNAKYLTSRVKGNPAVAKIYGVLLAPDRILVKENGCSVRALFRQRMFVEDLAVLAPNSESPESLIALSGLLKYTPQSVVAAQFSKIFPLLLASLNVKAARVQAVALQSLCDSLPESSAAIEPYLETLVPSLLELSVNANAVEVRTSALKTLIALQKVLESQLQPYKDDVLGRLVVALGDKKREVRRYAVICRQAFF